MSWLRRGQQQRREPHLSFGSWRDLGEADPTVVQVCHPDWRGVRTVAYSFRTPVVECDDLDYWGAELVDELADASVDVVVVQGWPPGSRGFVELLAARGIAAMCVLHSSPVQHGAEPGEAAVVQEVLDLGREGQLRRVGMAKAGVPEAFGAAGYTVDYVPNRLPALPDFELRNLGEGVNVGVFAEPFWRKNVTTQLLAAGMVEGSRAHVLSAPANRYFGDLEVEVHGELPYDEFIGLQASVDVNLYVTLSECHPSTPQESYMTGVPCLMSRTSSVFRSDPILWDLTTTDEADNPAAIASAAERLLANKEEAIERATDWMTAADSYAAGLWETFVRP